MEDKIANLPERLVPLLAALRAASSDASTAVVDGRKSSKTGETRGEMLLERGSLVIALALTKTLNGESLLALYGPLFEGMLADVAQDGEYSRLADLLRSDRGSFEFSIADTDIGVKVEELSLSAMAFSDGPAHSLRLSLRVRVSPDELEGRRWLHELEQLVGDLKKDEAEVRERFITELRREEEVFFFDDEAQGQASDPLGIDADDDAEGEPAQKFEPAPPPAISAELQAMIDAMDIKTEAVPAGPLLDEAVRLQDAGGTIVKHPKDGEPFEVTVAAPLGTVRRKMARVTAPIKRSTSALDRVRGRKKKKKGAEE